MPGDAARRGLVVRSGGAGLLLLSGVRVLGRGFFLLQRELEEHACVLRQLNMEGRKRMRTQS